MKVDLYNINSFEREISEMQVQLLEMKNDWLMDNGWKVVCENVNPDIFTYQKGKFVTGRASEAVAKELEL